MAGGLNGLEFGFRGTAFLEIIGMLMRLVIIKTRCTVQMVLLECELEIGRRRALGFLHHVLSV